MCVWQMTSCTWGVLAQRLQLGVFFALWSAHSLYNAFVLEPLPVCVPVPTNNTTTHQQQQDALEELAEQEEEEEELEEVRLWLAVGCLLFVWFCCVVLAGLCMWLVVGWLCFVVCVLVCMLVVNCAQHVLCANMTAHTACVPNKRTPLMSTCLRTC